MMRLLNLNKRPLWYANPTGRQTPVLDEQGYETGDYKDVYTDPAALPLNVSGAAGEAAAEAFGAFTDYSRTVAAPLGCPIAEGSLVWFGADPGTDQPNYRVVRVANSLNGLLYALQEVTGEWSFTFASQSGA